MSIFCCIPRPDKEEAYALSKFDPLLLDIVADLANKKLPADQFPYVKPPQDAGVFGAAEFQSARANKSKTIAQSWTQKGSGLGGKEGAANGSNSAAEPPPAGRRLLVFVIGGVTRGEMRVAHQCTKALKRDVLLVSTSVETPATFVEQLYRMSSVSRNAAYP